MKKILFLLAMMPMFLAGCSSKEKTAKSLIKEDLKNTLNDYSSYESVMYSNIDSSFTDVDNDSNAILIANRLKLIDNKLAEYLKEGKYYMSIGAYAVSQEYSLKMDSITKIGNPLSVKLDSIIANFKPSFNGYKITHRFRCSNSLGGKIISEYTYLFDKGMTKIINKIEKDRKADIKIVSN